MTETAIPIGLGIRCDEPVLGLVAAVLALMVRAETALVAVARLETGRTKMEDTVAEASSSVSLLARLRRMVGVFPFFRAFIAVEASVLSLIAAIVDEAGGNGDTDSRDRDGADRRDHRRGASGRDGDLGALEVTP